MDRISQSPASTKKRRGRAGKRAAATPPSTDLYLAATGAHVAPAHYRDRPLLSNLVTEDTCWQFQVAEWRTRRPSWWKLAERREWRREGTVLDEKRDRMRADATELGLRLTDTHEHKLGRGSK